MSRIKKALYNKEYYKNNKVKCLLNVKKCAQAKRLLVLSKYGNKCSCCGETHIEFLAIDHINNDGAQHRKQVGESGIYRDIIKRNFPSEFRILCHNCNMSSAFTRHECPHGFLSIKVCSLKEYAEMGDKICQ